MSEKTICLVSEVFSQADAKELNRRVCEEINPTLFLFNDYQPDEQPAFYEKDRFRTNVDNLYRLTADAGFVLKYLRSIAKDAHCYGGALAGSAEKVEQIVSNVKTVRTVHAHNLGVGHHFFNRKMKQNYNNITANYDLSKESGYVDFNKLVLGWASKLKKALSCFIEEVSSLGESNKKELIDSWQNIILSYYAQLHNKVYLGVMASVFYGRCPNALQKEISETNIISFIMEWVYSYFRLAKQKCQEMEKEVEDLDQELESGKASEKFCEIAKSERAKVIEEKSEISRWLPNSEWEGNSIDTKKEATDLYKSQIQSRLLDTLKRNPHCSMLPEELIRIQVEETFKNVPVPEYIK